MLTYALGRGLEHYDAPAVRAILREAAPDDYRLTCIDCRHRAEHTVPNEESIVRETERNAIPLHNEEDSSPPHVPARRRRDAGFAAAWRDDAGIVHGSDGSATPVRRLGFVYGPNGIARNFKGINYWTPKGEGTNFELSTILTPLAPYRDRMLVVSGLAQHQADAFDDGANGDHTRGTSTWLTGVHPKRTEGADVRNGISADQIAAAQLGKNTALPSLELAIDLNFLGGQCENSYSCSYHEYARLEQPHNAAADGEQSENRV